MECLILGHIYVLGNIHNHCWKQCALLTTIVINFMQLISIFCVVDRCLKNFCWMLIGLWMLACGCGYHAHLSFSSFFIAIVQCGLDARLTPMEITFGRMLIVILNIHSHCVCVHTHVHAHPHTTSQQNLRHNFLMNGLVTSEEDFFHTQMRVCTSVRCAVPFRAYSKYLPVLKNFPTRYIHEPWNAPEAVQKAAKCIIGKEYSLPMVNHAVASRINIERMKQVYQQLSKYRGPGVLMLRNNNRKIVQAVNILSFVFCTL